MRMLLYERFRMRKDDAQNPCSGAELVCAAREKRAPHLRTMGRREGNRWISGGWMPRESSEY